MSGKKHPFQAPVVPSDDHEAQRFNINSNVLPELVDHGFQDMVVLAGSTYVEALLASAFNNGASTSKRLESIAFKQVFLLPETDDASCNVFVRKSGASQYALFASSENTAPTDAVEPFVTATISDAVDEAPTASLDVDKVLATCTQHLDGSELYRGLLANGNAYGEGFQAINTYNYAAGEVLATVDLPASAKEAVQDFFLHPVLLDACIQTVIASQLSSGQTYMLVGIDELRYVGGATAMGWIHASVQPIEGGKRKFSG